MSKKRLGIGFIGAGFITKFHIRSWVGVRDADILGIVSRSPESAQKAADLARRLRVGQAKVYASVSEMVASPAIDALWVCSPNYNRLEIMEEIVHAVKSGTGEIIGVACEKPLGRNVQEAQKMSSLVREAGLLDGYLEDQIFSPSVVRGKEILWTRGAATTGRPYLARASEEHGGPHMPWFWEGSLQGGGVINDMMCHSVEEARFMLTPPGAERSVIKPRKVMAYANCLKWQIPDYAEELAKQSDGGLDYLNRPAEDFARAVIEYEGEKGEKLLVETTTSWCYVGAGLRLSMELLGPEYSLSINTLDSNLKIFFSRKVQGKQGEDLVEKQNAETGQMPIVSSEEIEYGYTDENRHMVQSFLDGTRPRENFTDGEEVTKLLMAAYMSIEEERTIIFPPEGLEDFIPAVAKGEWNPQKKA
ncbi:MAG: gfo/Idh/MocA family oxidoreductase [Candidatus Aminicenantes bacterium]|nr:gfo/Idh/MocA family oxidoreductase [Candidatus Aminicenantes bacterium]